jgi:hypothetical protein
MIAGVAERPIMGANAMSNVVPFPKRPLDRIERAQSPELIAAEQRFVEGVRRLMPDFRSSAARWIRTDYPTGCFTSLLPAPIRAGRRCHSYFADTARTGSASVLFPSFNALKSWRLRQV